MNHDFLSLQPDRPPIITSEIEVIRFYHDTDVKAAAQQMIAGTYILVEEFYSNGLEILAELKRTLLNYYSDKKFQGQRDYRSAFRKASHLLLVEVQEHKLLVEKAPQIGWLKLLYPEISEFYISFPEIQGMNSAWQWYKKGIEVKTLGITLHPFYGTYFPTRFDHLTLFDKWLKKYVGSKERAIEIGIGSGILSFQLIQNGFETIFATDTNKNAIIGVAHECKRLGYDEKITLNHGDLFENCNVKADVIVFNPPWLLAKHALEEGFDKAIYYEKELFPRFFEQAQKHLAPEGKLVLLFSNLAQVIDEKSAHPIIEELRTNDRFRKELHLRRDVIASSKKTKRTDARENEKVELWVLTQKQAVS
ncbi:MAG: methyltransferase [Sulfurospirillaceae bacterium]|nr:methyltransferase [Sulfurospirillaceae bacterium]MDD2826573.1 methyltransferase [Sulfurospirillaceae bacterium]